MAVPEQLLHVIGPLRASEAFLTVTDKCCPVRVDSSQRGFSGPAGSVARSNYK